MLKFLERFFWIAAAIDPIGSTPDEMWDEEDGFYYDVLRLPDGSGERMKVRSVVGLLPLCATTSIPPELMAKFPRLRGQVDDYLRRNHDLLVNIADPTVPGVAGRHLLSLVNRDKLRRILERMLDEERFLSPHGIRVAVPLAPRPPLRAERERARLPRRLRSGRVDHGRLRWQLQLARAGLVPHQRPDHPLPAAALRLLRRRLHGRVPHRFGQPDDPVRGVAGALPPPHLDLPPGTRTAAARSTAAPPSSRRTSTGGTTSCSTSTSTATTAPAWAPRTRPVGPGWWPG